MSGERTVRTTLTQDTLYKYDALSHLRQVELPAINGTHPVIQYEYDQLGRRISRSMTGPNSEPTRKWVYRDGLPIAAELDASDNITSRFVYSAGRMPVQMIRGNTVYLLVTNYLGSLRAVVRLSDGEIMQSMEYDEFGRVVTDEVVNGFERVPFGYAGGLYDRGTGLVRFGARDYDAETGRWVSKDPVGFAGGSTLLYGYAGGDPVNWVEFTGLDPLQPYGDPQYAAIIGLLEARSEARDAYVEGAGVVYTFGNPSDPLATFYHTPATLGAESNVAAFFQDLKYTVPPGATVVSWYHLHLKTALEYEKRWDSWPFSPDDEADMGVFANMYLKYRSVGGYVALGDGSIWYAEVQSRGLSPSMCVGVSDGLTSRLRAKGGNLKVAVTQDESGGCFCRLLACGLYVWVVETDARGT